MEPSEWVIISYRKHTYVDSSARNGPASFGCTTRTNGPVHGSRSRLLPSRGQYYDQDVEEGLAQDIEGPGYAVIDKVRRQEALNNTERTQLSMYLLTMATRGPRQRRKALEEVAPKALDSTIKEIEAQIQKAIDESGGDPRAIARMKELHAVREKVAKTPPKNIVDLIRPIASVRTSRTPASTFS